MNSKRHRFLKEQNQVDFSDKLNLPIEKLSSSVMQKTYCEEKNILLIEDGNAHPKWATAFSEEACCMTPFHCIAFRT